MWCSLVVLSLLLGHLLGGFPAAVGEVESCDSSGVGGVCADDLSNGRQYDRSRKGSLNVLLLGMGIRGHLMPLLELAQELRGRGHQVVVGTQDHALPWVVRHRCIYDTEFAAGHFDVCTPGYEFNNDFHDVVSLGNLIRDRNPSRKMSSSLSSSPPLLRSMWALLRYVYIDQTETTIAYLCKLLGEMNNDSRVDCPKFDGVEGMMGNDKVAGWKPSVIVGDIGLVGVSEMAELFGIPLVLNSPTLLFSLEDRLPTWNPLVPTWGTGFSKSMTFFQRCVHAVFPRLLAIALTPDFVFINQLRSRLGLKEYVSQQQVFQGGCILVNTAIGFDYPRYVDPHVYFTGPLLGALPKTQPSQVVKWLDSIARDTRVVVVCMGSLGVVDPNLFEAVLRGTRKTKVLWVLSSSKGLGDEVGIIGARSIIQFLRTTFKGVDTGDVLENYIRYCSVENAPPFCQGSHSSEYDHLAVPMELYLHVRRDDLTLGSLLKHEAVDMVVSYCGLTLAQEAIVASVPLVCIPFYADQFDVSARVVDAGVGMRVERPASTSYREIERVLKKHIIEIRRTDFQPALQRTADTLLGAGGVSRAADIIEITSCGKAWDNDSNAGRMNVSFDVYIFLFAVLTLITVAMWVSVGAVFSIASQYLNF
mmetsp:Transcript_8902/g.14473  ORF Transcript_8902/g.14473 Transcript_8902/m.14473 type:complete len:644 (+) Transcript_8902:2-1933(+)